MILMSELHVYNISVADRSTDTSILQMAVDARHAAEVTAKQLLCQADGCSVGHNLPSTAGSPWEDLSSSRTARYQWIVSYVSFHCISLSCYTE